MFEEYLLTELFDRQDDRERRRETETERSCMCWSSPQKAATGGAGHVTAAGCQVCRGPARGALLLLLLF